MRKLNHEAYQRSRHFLLHQARPLEKALFQHRFESTGTKEVLNALRFFQNIDGGFGRALEPDLRSPSSSALATAIGLRTLNEIECPPSEPTVKWAVAYLRSTFDEKEGVWQVAPADVNQYPHAPWWHDQDGSLERTFDGFRIIPRALIVAGLWHYSTMMQREWLEKVTEETIQHIVSVPELGNGGGSDLEYAIALAEAKGLPHRYVQRMQDRISEVLPKVVVSDPERWGTYCLTPLRVIRTPDTIGADLIADLVQKNLDHQIEKKSLEGTWDPVWSWMGSYPEVWAQARQEWRGHLTLETLTQLKAFGRIET